MNATIKDGVLTITVPLAKNPMPSKPAKGETTGKSLMLYNGHGAQKLAIDGDVVTVALNVYVPNPAFVAAA